MILTILAWQFFHYPLELFFLLFNPCRLLACLVDYGLIIIPNLAHVIIDLTEKPLHPCCELNETETIWKRKTCWEKNGKINHSVWFCVLFLCAGIDCTLYNVRAANLHLYAPNQIFLLNQLAQIFRWLTIRFENSQRNCTALIEISPNL